MTVNDAEGAHDGASDTTVGDPPSEDLVLVWRERAEQIWSSDIEPSRPDRMFLTHAGILEKMRDLFVMAFIEGAHFEHRARESRPSRIGDDP